MTKRGETRICPICLSPFWAFRYKINADQAKTCSRPCAYMNAKGIRRSPESEFKKGQMSDHQHPNWKGDKVGYFGLHTWVQRKKGKPTVCEVCFKTDGVVWANKSHKYKRDVEDWLALCGSCHREYDGFTKLKRAQIAAIRNSTEVQTVLASQFGVSQSLISYIKKEKIWK